MSEPIIEVKGLSKRYRLGEIGSTSLKEEVERLWNRARGKDSGKISKDFWALKDVSFKIQPGEVVGVIGRNGAGKSTLLKILSRITQQTTGEITLRGRIASLLEVGTGFHPELSGRENIFLNGAILGMTKGEIRKKLDTIVDFSGVEKFLDTPVKRYSSGMYVRLAFAVAAHLDPEILIVDEVLAVGDAEFQKKCLGRMKDVATGGRTVLFVSHNMNAIESLCGHIIHLQAGQVREQTHAVKEAISHYMSFGRDETTQSEWSNSSGSLENRWFRPSRFYLADEAGRVAKMPVRNDRPLYVYIEGDVEERENALNIGYALYDEAGSLLFWSCNTDVAEQQWAKLEPGRNTLRCAIPQRLLNQGNYRMELIVALYQRQWISCPGSNAPAITLSIQGGLSDSPYWMERRPGILAPVCGWTRADADKGSGFCIEEPEELEVSNSN